MDGFLLISYGGRIAVFEKVSKVWPGYPPAIRDQEEVSKVWPLPRRLECASETK